MIVRSFAAVNAPDIAGALILISHGGAQSVNHMSASQLESFLRKRGWNPKKTPLILDACRTGEGPGSIADHLARNSGGVVIAPSDRTWTTKWGSNFDKPYPPVSDNPAVSSTKRNTGLINSVGRML